MIARQVQAATGARRMILGAVALSLIAASVPTLACVTIAYGFDTAAHYRFLKAAKIGDIAAMQTILQTGEVTISDTNDWETLLQWAIFNNQPKTLISLLKIGAKPEQPDALGGNAVLLASGHKNPKWLKILLANGADPNVRHASNGMYPLRAALMANRDEQFADLVAARADLTQTDGGHNAPLHIAAQVNKPWHVMDLLMAGADPLARNAQGQTFQSYLFMTKDELLNRTTRKGRQAVLDYLWIKEIPIHNSAPPRVNGTFLGAR